jgi:CysZ protein
VSFVGDLGRGPGFLALGWRLLATPGVRPLLVWPLLVTFLVYAGTVAAVLVPTMDWLENAMADLPQWFHDWFGFLVTLLEVLLGLLLVLLVGWVALLLAGILASPFYGRIAALVEARLRGRASTVERGLAGEAWAAIRREFQKLAWTLPRMLAILILGLLPVVNTIASPLAFLFGAWVMTAQFTDFTPENRGLPFTATRSDLRGRRGLGLGFGIPLALGLGIPLVNLLVAPAAVAGGTALWLRIRGEWDGTRGV